MKNIGDKIWTYIHNEVSEIYNHLSNQVIIEVKIWVRNEVREQVGNKIERSLKINL